MVSAAAARSTNLETRRALDDVADRLHDHAGLYGALQLPRGGRASDASVYLRKPLVAISRAKLARSGIRIVYREPAPILCSAVQCWTLGMIVSELVTNAVRHAFDTQGGIIDVGLNQGNGLVECCVSDDGSAAQTVCPGSGLGIVQALVRSLDGSIRLHFGPSGTRAILSFPRAPVACPNSVHKESNYVDASL